MRTYGKALTSDEVLERIEEYEAQEEERTEQKKGRAPSRDQWRYITTLSLSFAVMHNAISILTSTLSFS